ncbi:MAG TPA: alpha/beta hydrolase [Yinghuangia sp.]|nr:alpha/beta hydrolase [Yinghuangia sp.]
MRTINRRAARMRTAIPAALVATALVGGCSPGPGGSVAGRIKDSAGKGSNDPELAAFYTQDLAWSACDDDPETEGDERDLECTRLRVPLDYADPDGKEIRISVMRLRSDGSGPRVGSMLTNPGGPGGSGLDYLKNSFVDVDPAIHASFDIIGFDPRGVGESSPVSCLDDDARDRMNAEDGPEPQDPEAEEFEDALDKEFVAGCQEKSGELLPHVGSRNVARDMDILRSLLGDEKLNYLGYSYGTYLGALYAEEFPARVGRLVLDGAVDPAADPLDDTIGQQVGFEQSYTRFAQDCATRASCPLGTDPDRAALVGIDFLDGLRDEPLRTRLGDGRELTSNLGWTGMISLLYSDAEQGWPALREAFNMAMDGDGTAFMVYADAYNGRDEDGRYDGMMDAFRVISCADSMAEAPSPQRVQEALERMRREAPLFSRDVTAADFDDPSCEFWPFRTTEKPHAVKAPGSNPILVVGTTGDPATPYAAAERLAAGFENATLLTLDGEGHTAYGHGNECIDDAVNAYLVSGTLPAAGTRCS